MTKEPAHPEIGTRIADAMDALDLKLRDVAEHFGKTVQTVHNWRKGKHLPNPPEFLQLADLLKVNVVWLTTGLGLRGPENLRNAIVIQNARGRLVPRLTLEQVSRPNFLEIIDPDGEKVLTHYPCGPKSFEFRIVDTSNAPDFTVGDSIVIDPDLRPEPGDMVLALVGNLTVFRKFIAKGGTAVELRPLNTDWHPDLIDVGSTGSIVGTMSEHAKPRRN